MMRVAVIVDSLKVGGAQRLVAAFASNASKHGITPIVIALNESRTTVVSDAIVRAGVRIVTFSGRTIFDPFRFRRLIKFLKEEHIDIVQTHLMYANILGTLASRMAGLPVVTTLHSVDVPMRRRFQWLKPVEDYCLQHFATRIVAVGNMVAEAHQDDYGERSLNVIPNGIAEHEEIPAQTRERLRSEIGSDDMQSIIITVGRFSRAKGYEDLIEAFSLLQQKDLKSVLLMVGSGSMQDSIRTQIEHLNLDRSVILAGERHDIPQLLASSDVFASSSHREGLPLSVLEAMMAGLPVVATSVGDIPNVVTHETGVLVPPHQPEMLAAALEELIINPGKRRQMGKAARARAIGEYSVDVWMTRHVKLYNDVLGSSRLQTAS